MGVNTMDERIEIGADVIGSSGSKIGTVAYVIVHPPQMHVTDYVVSTGILGRDVVVPVDKVDRVAAGKLYLTIDKDALQHLLDYVEVHYNQPPQTWVPSGGFFYPAQSVLWPAGASYYPEPSSVTVNAPADTVGLSHGMEVESSDGHKVGSIKALDEDPASGDVTDLIIKEGLVFTHDVRVPCSLVAEIHEGKVTLNVTRDELTEKTR